MSNNNTPNIEVGMQLICKNEKPLTGNEVGPPLTLEEKYEAKQIHTCGCGKQHVDVGLVSKYNWVRCYHCEEELPSSDKIHWCHPSRFEIAQ